MADEPRKIMHWRGQPIDDLPREELIQIISYLSGQLAGHYTYEAIRARALGSSENQKMQSTAGTNRAFLAAAWGFSAGISGSGLFYVSGFWFGYYVLWFLTSLVGAGLCAYYVNHRANPSAR